MTGILNRIYPTAFKEVWRPSKWNIYDVAAVLAIVICLQILGYKLPIYAQDNKCIDDLISALMQIAPTGVTLAWVWLFRKATPEELGLRKGRWSIGRCVGIAVPIGLASGIVMLFIEGKVVHFVSMLAMIVATIIHTPMSPNLFGLWILTPVSEEIMERGFLYTYLRPRIGVLPGLLMQTAVFSAFHLYRLDQLGSLDHFGVIVVMGMIFGLLYELSGSLYPSIICHSLYNMTVVAITAASKLGL